MTLTPGTPATPEQPLPSLLGTGTRTVVFKLLSNGALTVVAILTARALGPSNRGVLVLLLTLALFSMLIGSLGVNVAGRLHLVAPHNPVPSGHYFSLVLTLLLAQIAICLVISSTLLPLADVHLPLSQRLLFAVLGAATLGVYILNDTLNAFGWVSQAAAVDASGSIAQLVLVALVLATGVARMGPLLVALIVGSGLQMLVALLLLRRRGVDVTPRYSATSWRLLIRSGLPGLAAGLGEIFTFRIDRYLLALFATPAAVGVYSVASTAPEILRLPSLALSPPIFHRLASGAAEVRDFLRVRRVCLLATVALAGATALAAPALIQIAFGPEYESAVTPLRILLLGELGIAVYHLDGASLGGLGRMGSVSIAALTGLIIVVIADVVLIGAYGVAGAAWASALAYTAMGLVVRSFLKRGSPARWRGGADP